MLNVITKEQNLSYRDSENRDIISNLSKGMWGVRKGFWGNSSWVKWMASEVGPISGQWGKWVVGTFCLFYIRDP